MAGSSTISESACALFTDSQYSFSSHRKNIRSLVKLFNDSCNDITKLQDFYLAIIHCLNVILSLKKHEDIVNRMMKFLVGFIISLSNEGNQNNNSNNNDTIININNNNSNQFIHNHRSIITDFIENIMKWCLDYIDVKARNVRARLGQLLVACVNSLDEISETVWQILQSKMYERLFDREAVVRIQSVYVFARLQGLEIEGTNITIGDIFMDLLRHDTSVEVRKAVLKEIDITEESLPVILERAHDVDVGIRKMLFSLRLRDIDFGQLSIDQREKVLKFGLGDRESTVKEACVDLILNYWSASVDYNIIKFLSHLDVVNNLEIAELFLKAVLKAKPDFFGNDELFKMEVFLQNLTKETALLMRVALESKKNDNGNSNSNNKGDSLIAIGAGATANNTTNNNITQEDCLPELCTIASLIKKNYEDWLICDGNEELKEEYEFIIKQLLSCTALADFGDEVGRRSMINVVLELICNFQLGESLFKSLCDLLVVMTCNPKEFLQVIGDVLSDVRDIFTNMEFEIDIRTIAHLRGLQLIGSALGMEGPNPLLYNILDLFIIPAVNSELLSVQVEGLRTLGLCCINDLNLSREYQELLIAFVELEQLETKSLAIQIAFDIICTFPKEDFGKLINVIITCLYHQAQEVHCTSAEGFAKLLLHRIYDDSQVLEGLFYLYLHPLNGENIRLKQCLSYFWPCYAQGREESIANIAPSVIKTCGSIGTEGAVNINKITDYICLLINDGSLLLKLLENLSWEIAKDMNNKSLISALGRVPIIVTDQQQQQQHRPRENDQNTVKKLILMLGMIIKGMTSDKANQAIIRKVIANLIEIDDPTFIPNSEEITVIRNKLEDIIIIEEPIINNSKSISGARKKAISTRNNFENMNLGANIIDDIDDIIS